MLTIANSLSIKFCALSSTFILLGYFTGISYEFLYLHRAHSSRNLKTFWSISQMVLLRYCCKILFSLWKICDFGTGRQESQMSLRMTRIKQVATFNYRAPEAILSKDLYNELGMLAVYAFSKFTSGPLVDGLYFCGNAIALHGAFLSWNQSHKSDGIYPGYSWHTHSQVFGQIPSIKGMNESF